MNDTSIRNLACAITMQAVRDYFADKDKQHQILKDLRSPWMDFITGGLSVMTADQLEKHPNEIKARMRKMPKEE
jgi:hypothetical protein